MKPSSETLNDPTLSEGEPHQAMLDRDRHFDGIFINAVRQQWDPRELPPISVFLLAGRVVNMDEVLSRYP